MNLNNALVRRDLSVKYSANTASTPSTLDYQLGPQAWVQLSYAFKSGRPEMFRGNMNICLHFRLFFDTEISRVFKNFLVLYSQCHACWCPGDGRSQGINSQCIDVVLPTYSGLRIRVPSQYKDLISRYGYFHYKDKTVVRPSYLCNGDLYIGKTTSLYWETLG